MSLLQRLLKVETIRAGAAVELVVGGAVLGLVGPQVTQRGWSKIGMSNSVFTCLAHQEPLHVHRPMYNVCNYNDS